jgi:hypothetical protein
MATAATAAGIGALGSLWSSNQAASAQMELAQPYVNATKFALPALQNLAQGYYAPRLGQESAYLKAGLKESLSNIGRQEKQSLAGTQTYWTNKGNVGRGRGESLRIAQQAMESRNQANLGYGQAQQQYKDNTAQQLSNLYGMLGNLGGTGLSTASGAIGTQLTGQTNFWNTMGGLDWSQIFNFGSGGGGSGTAGASGEKNNDKKLGK